MITQAKQAPMSATPVQMVIAKPGLDGHDRAGTEVTYIRLHQTAAQIVPWAIQEEASVAGLSVLSGAHLTAIQM
jgi:methylmalonyl-CoA mutase C-terminal domain/subunit